MLWELVFSMNAQRQIVAIMFCDIVGYTAMMQSDESLAVQTVTRFKSTLEEVIPNFRGEIHQFYGDGSLAFFNSTVDAVQCALQIQKSLQDGQSVPLRIGLNVGEIRYEGGEVYGDGVNIASRIESVGVPGSVLSLVQCISTNQKSQRFQIHKSRRPAFQECESAGSCVCIIE